jgi:hypothetical protein
MPTAGRVTISLTSETDAVVGDLCRRFHIKERMDVAKVGFAYGVRVGLVPTAHDRPLGSGTGSTWNVGTLDPGGELRSLVLALYPDSEEDPYLLVEALINRGLVALARGVEADQPVTLTDLSELPPPRAHAD